LAEKIIPIIYDVRNLDDLDKAEAIFRKIAAATDKAGKEVSDLSKDSKKAGQDTSNAFKTASKGSEKLTKSLKDNERGFVSLSNVGVRAGARIGASLAAAFTVGAAIALGKKIFDITAEFQKFEAVLTNTLGSQKQAEGAMIAIQQAGAKTNFSVQELTESYVKFANRGIKLSQAELLKLADIANSTGKSFDQLTEAALDSFTGENERLKEFGITAKKTGETTQFTFKGVTTEVKNTQEAVKQYLFSLADLEGVSGATASISATLEGRVSNLGDAFDQLFLNIGKGTTGFLPGLISAFTDFISLMAQSFKSVQQIKKEISALSLSEALRGDIEEVEALAQAYVKNGRTIEEATKKAAADVIESFRRLQNGRKVLSEEEKADLDERIKNLQKQFVTTKQSVDSELGILAKLRKELKEVQEAREKARSEGEIKAYSERALKIQAEIQRLEGLGKQAERTKIQLEALASIDYLTGLTSYGQKLKAALGDVYQKIYGEQIKGAGEATEANKKQVDSFVEGIEAQINARAVQSIKKREQDQKDEAEEKARAERRKEIAQEATVATVDLINSIAAYQSQADNNRLAALEAQKERELAIAGDNTNKRAQLEQEFDARIRAIRRRQAEREKRVAIFNAIINIAQGVTKAIAQGGIAGIVLGALVAAAGAVQIAAINNQETPAFNKGTKGVPGPNTNKDTVQAMLTPGEMVIPTKTKKKYWPVLDKIFDNKIDPDLLNGIALGKYSGGSLAYINDNKEVVEAIKGLPVTEWTVSDDDLARTVKKRNSRTTYVSERYRSKGR
jgi:hypothetical protein